MEAADPGMLDALYIQAARFHINLARLASNGTFQINCEIFSVRLKTPKCLHFNTYLALYSPNLAWVQCIDNTDMPESEQCSRGVEDRVNCVYTVRCL